MSPTPRVSHCGKTEPITPPHQARFGQNQAQNAAASSPTSAKPNTKCRGVKPNSAKPGSKCHHNPDNSQKQNGHQARLRLNRTENAPSCPPAAQTDLKMPPKPRLRQNRSQNAAQTPYPAKHPTEFKRLNPDGRKTKVKMSTKSSL